MANRTVETTTESSPVMVTAVPPTHQPAPQNVIPGLGRGVERDTAVLQRVTDGRLPRTGNSLLQLQRSQGNRYVQRVVARTKNQTGLPDDLKAGVETLSGLSLDDVRVHYNSSKPSQLQALAYTEGTEIHVAPGQETHLPHEAWHVVQQIQGRVQPTMQIKQASINNEVSLEHEADVMGHKAAALPASTPLPHEFPGLLNVQNGRSSSESPIQPMSTSTTDQLADANPAYLRELATIHAPGLWDYTNIGAFAVSHKGRKYALGVDDANYSPVILSRTERTRFFGLGSYHFSQEIDLKGINLKNDLHGKDCADAAEYLMHYEHGNDPTTPFSQVEKTTGLSSDYNPLTFRPNVLPHQVPAGVKDANARAEIGEAYCIVSEPASGKYNFHYGCVAAKKGDETLTVEGFATSSALTTPDWSFNVYDSVSTFHGVWQPNMTKVSPPLAPGYPFTFVTKLT